LRGKVDDLAIIDHLAKRGAGSFQQGRLGGDFDLLSYASGLDRNIDSHILQHVDNGWAIVRTSEADEFDDYSVLARRKGSDEILPDIGSPG